MGRSAVKCGQGRSVWGLGRGPDNTCKLLTIVFGPQYLLHNYYPLTSLFPFPSGQIIFPPWFILSLGSEHQEIPEWRSGRELRGTRCEFYPRQNLSRLWGSRIVRLSPISNSGSLSPPWSGMWMEPERTSPSCSFHHLGEAGGKQPRSVCLLHLQVLANVRSPTIHASQERCFLLPCDSWPSFPLVSTRTQWTETSLAQGPFSSKQRRLKYGLWFVKRTQCLPSRGRLKLRGTFSDGK